MPIDNTMTQYNNDGYMTISVLKEYSNYALAALPTIRPSTRPLDARHADYRLQASKHGLIVTAG